MMGSVTFSGSWDFLAGLEELSCTLAHQELIRPHPKKQPSPKQMLLKNRAICSLLGWEGHRLCSLAEGWHSGEYSLSVDTSTQAHLKGQHGLLTSGSTFGAVAGDTAALCPE